MGHRLAIALVAAVAEFVVPIAILKLGWGLEPISWEVVIVGGAGLIVLRAAFGFARTLGGGGAQ